MTGLNSVMWYHCYRSGLVISAISLLDYCRVRVSFGCAVVDSYTFQIPVTPFLVPSRTMFYFLSTVICVAVNVTVQLSPHSFPMDISAPDWMWDNMCDVLSLVYNKGQVFSSDLWVACIRLPYGSSTCGLCYFLTLFSHAVSNLM